MPTIDGVEFLHLMQSLGLNHPVVFFTGFGIEELRGKPLRSARWKLLDKRGGQFKLPERLRGFAPSRSVSRRGQSP